MNPFAQSNGATNTGMSANQNPNARSPNAGPNSGNTNSGTDPTNNNGNNDINKDPNKVVDPNAPKAPLKEGDDGYDPMLDFGKLWEDTPDDPKNPKPKKVGYVADLDPKALADSVGKMDFTKNITPEQRTAMLAGGEEGLTAMLGIINQASRQAVSTTYQAGNRMVASALEKAEAGFLEKVPGHVKNQLVDNSLSDNPIMNDPAYAPIVEATKQRFLTRFPKATAAQVNTAVTGFFEDMVTKGTKKPANDGAPTNKDKLRTGAGDANWMDWAAEEMGLKDE